MGIHFVSVAKGQAKEQAGR